MIGPVLGSAAALPLAGALVYRKLRQRKAAEVLKSSAASGIHEQGFVRIGGIEQWLGIRGEDRSNPLLLVIHGGPGCVYSVLSPALRAWEKQFTLVQWDQRGAGRTFGRNRRRGCGTITFDRLAADGIDIAEHLRERLGARSLFLLGSSVGSIIALRMAQQRPDLFTAYVGTDQNVRAAPDEESWRLTINALREAGHVRAATEFESLGRDPSRWTLQIYGRRNRLAVKAVTTVPNMITDLLLPALVSAPGYSLLDLVDIFAGMRLSLEQLCGELLAFDAQRSHAQLELPFFLFQGDTDWMTSTFQAERYFDCVRAPLKQFALIRNAGHLAMFAQPRQFLDELVTRVRPLAMKENGRNMS